MTNHPIIPIALAAFCDFSNKFLDPDQSPILPDSPYFLETRIQSDLDIDDHNRLMILECDLDDDLRNIHLILIYTDFDNALISLQIAADTEITQTNP